MAQNTNSADHILNSWKEIAAYLQRGIRTIQRWESSLGLPVHRIGSGKRAPVFAKANELNLWLWEAGLDNPRHAGQAESVAIRVSSKPEIQRLRELRLTMRNLRHQVAEASVRQRKQAQLAHERLAKLRARVNGDS